MKIHVIDNHSIHTEELKKLLIDHEHTFSDFETTDYSQLEADVIILSGSHENPFYSASFEKEISFITSTDIPVVGICLGCQLIAYAYGSELHREENKLKGIYEIKDLRNHKKYMVYEGHHFCINQLGDEIEGIAASEYGYEIIKHKTKNQWGLQFHPEADDKTHNGELLLTIILADIIK